MRIINSLFILLLAGMWSPSSCITEESNSSRKGLILSILELIHSPELVKFDTPEEKNEAINNLLKKSCDKNGGKSAYKIAEESWKHYINCEESTNRMKSNVTKHQMRDNLVESVKEACTHVPNMKECAKRLKDSIEPCLEPEEHRIVKLIYDVMNAIFQFTCDIDGEPMKKFVADDGEECFRSKRMLLLSCFIEIPSLSHMTDSTEELLPAGIQGLAKFLPTAKDCGEIEKFQSCSIGVLKGCTHPTSAEMTDLFMNKLKEAMDCKTLFAENAASTSVTNGILITVAMTIFIHFV